MKQLLLVFAVTSTSLIFSQNNPSLPSQANSQWKTNGNVVDTNQFIGSKNERPVIFKSNNSERLRLSPDGNIGIGTATPQAKLDVNGEVIFRDDITILNTPVTLDPINIRLLGVEPNGGVSTTNAIGLLDIMYGPCDLVDINGNPIPLVNPHWSNGLNKIYVDCSPVNVGIGTDDPTSRLDVRGVTFTSKIAIGGADPVQQQEYFHLTSPSQDPNNSSDIFIIDNPLSELLKVNNQGLLSTMNIDNSGTINSRQLIITNNTNDPYLVIQNNNLKVLQLDSDGLLRSRKVKVDVFNWPDYVFDKDYSLLSLKDTEHFINEHGHLPGVPSANKIESEGLDLAEMNKVLMRKVEELTLYIIDQNRRIEELEKINKE